MGLLEDFDSNALANNAVAIILRPKPGQKNRRIEGSDATVDEDGNLRAPGIGIPGGPDLGELSDLLEAHLVDFNDPHKTFARIVDQLTAKLGAIVFHLEQLTDTEAPDCGDTLDTILFHLNQLTEATTHGT
jgi:hypothetical protein